MRWLRWEKGRQDSGYWKMLLLENAWGIPFDFYLLKFPCGSEIKPHVDKVAFGKHFRMNIVLRKPKAGGEFQCTNSIINTNRVKFFRPDVEEHSVSRITEGDRLVLSFGFVLK